MILYETGFYNKGAFILERIEIVFFIFFVVIAIFLAIYFFSKRNKQEKFCGQCGSGYRIQLESCPFCSSQEVDNAEKFCGQCGSRYRIQLKSCPFCPVETE